MKTALDQNTELYKILNASTVLKSAITGDIYKTVRPANSVLEDIVVNTIVLDEGSLQRGVSNVNIHVADLQQTIGTSSTKYYAPNEGRLKVIADLVKPLIEDTYKNDFSLSISGSSLIGQPEINQHYFNFRVDFIFENP
ncbi:hypothetical protein [Dyadobacter sp. LHD-138]|uniref:hypothetical protein n=1 Tax=Dyadobacter sp. LHD-138 TaxID=3071413 RepID=UPI0027E1AA13|nr:hypothetical protein [Dyadobacter sp. LHD-138]MDQ6482222.1 hypothetical protein [Dyadobacter sp. LHD-138]